MQRFESDLAQQADQMSVILFSVITSGFFIVSFSLSHYISLFIFLTFPRCKSLTLHSFSLSLFLSSPHSLLSHFCSHIDFSPTSSMGFFLRPIVLLHSPPSTIHFTSPFPCFCLAYCHPDLLKQKTLILTFNTRYTPIHSPRANSPDSHTLKKTSKTHPPTRRLLRVQQCDILPRRGVVQAGGASATAGAQC